MTKIEKLMVALILVVLLAAPVSWIAGSYFEAEAYNRHTGANVSTWDAMWIELRVQAGPVSHE